MVDANTSVAPFVCPVKTPSSSDKNYSPLLSGAALRGTPRVDIRSIIILFSFWLIGRLIGRGGIAAGRGRLLVGDSAAGVVESSSRRGPSAIRRRQLNQWLLSRVGSRSRRWLLAALKSIRLARSTLVGADGSAPAVPLASSASHRAADADRWRLSSRCVWPAGALSPSPRLSLWAFPIVPRTADGGVGERAGQVFSTVANAAG